MIEQILGMSLEAEIKVENDSWKFKMLRPKERLGRAAVVAQLLGSVPLESVQPEDYNRAFIIASFQVAYISGPVWFKEKISENFMEFPDEHYLATLWDEYGKAEKRFEEAKKKFRPDKNS